MHSDQLFAAVGPEITDPEEESFLLFSQSIPSQDLGFVDSKVSLLDITIANRDLTIRQSPTILSSNREGGTTGAVVWKITPLLASWLCSPSNILFKYNILHSQAAVLELGCGISGIIGLTLGHQVASYVLTDQAYVMKLLTENLNENTPQSSSSARKRSNTAKPSKKGRSQDGTNPSSIFAKVLDWEEDQVSGSLVGLEERSSFDVVIACDCIYNDALIDPLVRTCTDACKLRLLSEEGSPTIVLVAQQLRSAEVFEGWLKEFHKEFRVWRLPDEELIDGLRSNSGFVIHIGVLR